MSQRYTYPSTDQLSRQAAERYAQLEAIGTTVQVRPRRLGRRRPRRLPKSATTPA